MKSLEYLLQTQRRIRVIGFDDSPFKHQAGADVAVAGIGGASLCFVRRKLRSSLRSVRR